MQQNRTCPRFAGHLQLFNTAYSQCLKYHSKEDGTFNFPAHISRSKRLARCPALRFPPLLHTQPPLRLQHPHRMVVDRIRGPFTSWTPPAPPRVADLRLYGPRNGAWALVILILPIQLNVKPPRPPNMVPFRRFGLVRYVQIPQLAWLYGRIGCGVLPHVHPSPCVRDGGSCQCSCGCWISCW